MIHSHCLLKQATVGAAKKYGRIAQLVRALRLSRHKYLL